MDLGLAGRTALVLGAGGGLGGAVAREGASVALADTVNVTVPGRIAIGRIRFLDEQRAAREGRPLAEVVTDSTASIGAGRYGEPDEYAGGCRLPCQRSGRLRDRLGAKGGRRLHPQHLTGEPPQ